MSVADLSSNLPYHVHFEKLSRTIITPHSDTNPTQTKWFYERARGQYRNARNREGFTKARRKAFDIKHPRSQMFTKEKLAKYINAYQEVYKGTKLVVAPHFVVKNVKNYSQFILYNTKEKVENNNIYFEDTIAKAILYQTCEKLYGVKPNSIGGLRFIVVPYAITYFGLKTDYKLDLYKIWRNQSLSGNLSNLLYDLMVQLDKFLVDNSPESLIEMWARKESCWELVKKQNFDLDYDSIKDDFISPNENSKRKIMSSDESIENEKENNIEKLKTIPINKWKEIEIWGEQTGFLSAYLRNIAYTIAGRIRNNNKFLDAEINNGIKIIDILIDKAPELLFNIEENANVVSETTNQITIDLIKKIVEWDRRRRRLKDYEFRFMLDLSDNKKELTPRNKKLALLNLEKVKKYGFRE